MATRPAFASTCSGSAAGLSLVARRVNTSIPDFEGLGLPPVMGEIASHDQGIVILAGVTGSGKSTTHRGDAPVRQHPRALPHRHDRRPDRIHIQG